MYVEGSVPSIKQLLRGCSKGWYCSAAFDIYHESALSAESPEVTVNRAQLYSNRVHDVCQTTLQSILRRIQVLARVARFETKMNRTAQKPVLRARD